jgi:hypothetical protein
MPRADKIKRWTPEELMTILKYLNENFESWYENRNAACSKATEAGNIGRDPKAVYNKIHTMLKTLEEYDKTKKKPNDPVWEDKKIIGLLRKISDKSKEKEEDKRAQSEETVRQEITSPRYDDFKLLLIIHRLQFMFFRFSTDPRPWYDALPDQSTSHMDTDEVIDIDRFDKMKLFDAKLKEYQDLPTQISQLRSELREMEEKVREKEEQAREKEERYKTLVIFHLFVNSKL